MSDEPFLSVILPCWNEAKNLERGVLEEVYEYLAEQPYSWEVIIVDDESTDDSWERVERFIQSRRRFRHVAVPHGGKPNAVWAGIQKAAGRIVLFADMDQSTPISEVGKLLPYFQEGFDVVIGSRGTSREGASALRKLGSLVFTGLRRRLFLRGIRDTQCGFKACRREAALRVFPKLRYFSQTGKAKGWRVSAYDVELLYLFSLAGYNIRAVEVEWRHRDASDMKGPKGEPARYVRESIEMARELLRVKRNQWSGLYRDVKGIAHRTPPQP